MFFCMWEVRKEEKECVFLDGREGGGVVGGGGGGGGEGGKRGTDEGR